MVVTEIFKSIQGESTYAGRPCIFVRLTGCNLRCRWCDTAYAFYGGTRMTVDDVMVKVRELAGVDGAWIPLVELTGGEPMLQPDVHPLIEKLLAEKYTVLIETSGERYVGELPREVVKVMDIKCPGSGEGGTLNEKNLEVLDRKDEIKFVIADEGDYVWAREFTRERRLGDIVNTVIFSPAHGELDPKALSEWILRDGLPVRLGLQLHKFIWGPEVQGV